MQYGNLISIIINVFTIRACNGFQITALYNYLKIETHHHTQAILCSLSYLRKFWFCRIFFKINSSHSLQKPFFYLLLSFLPQNEERKGMYLTCYMYKNMKILSIITLFCGSKI